MTARRVCRGATIGGALVLALLAGCTGDDDPAPPTSSSAGTGTSSATGSTSGSGTGTGTATGSPTTTATVEVPAAAKKKTAQGAEAFARFYLQTTATSQVSGDSGELRSLVGGCETCLDLADAIDDSAAKGEHYESNTQEIGLSRPLPGETEESFVVGVLVTLKENYVVNAVGERVARVKPAKVNFDVTVAWTGAGWKTQRVVIPA